MKKTFLTRTFSALIALTMLFTISAVSSPALAASYGSYPLHQLLPMERRPDDPKEIPEGLEIDWNHRYTYAELEGQLAALAKEYPKFSELYSIGT